MTITADDPRHGTPAGYQAHHRAGQRPCTPCREANYLTRMRLLRDHLRGEQITFTADQVQQLVQPWLEQGICPTAIARAASLNGAAGGRFVATLRNGGVVRRGTFHALEQITEADLPETSKVPADLTRRRINSLMAGGHELRSIPINPTGLWRTRSHVTIAIARTIRDHYTAHEQHPGTSDRTARLAQARGHVLPAAWDDPGTLAWPGLRLLDQPPAAEDDVDEAVVLRILGGDFHLHATPAERREVVARWTGSQGELSRLTGWKVDRYTTTGKAA